MSKPTELALILDPHSGMPRMFVRASDIAADKVWDAVEQAIAAGWDVTRFRNEAAEAWDGVLREAVKHAATEWRRK